MAVKREKNSPWLSVRSDVRLTAVLALTGAFAAAALGTGAFVAGCGDDDVGGGRAAGGNESRATTSSTSAARHEPIPDAVRTVESAAEDTIDFALAGKRDKAVETANALKTAADGPVAEALRTAGVSGSEIAEFQARANHVAKLAPQADLLGVALASNRAFAMVPGFFALYESPVPADVMELDHLDFEAKLQAKAGHSGALHSAVERLDRTWAKLRPGLLEAGGKRVAPRFDTHVERMQRLASGSDSASAEKEAQHGLDLVDQLETVYAG
jgi:hypothetical protein